MKLGFGAGRSSSTGVASPQQTIPCVSSSPPTRTFFAPLLSVASSPPLPRPEQIVPLSWVLVILCATYLGWLEFRSTELRTWLWRICHWSSLAEEFKAPCVIFRILAMAMLDGGNCTPPRAVSPCRATDDSCEEELSLLPRHTKVVVTGNNRTKSVLIGLHGVVKKAVGLGGWHWLVLTNGVEVKLQRNALSVLEPPNGNEDDREESEDALSSKSNVEDYVKPVSVKQRVRSSMLKSANRDHLPDLSFKPFKSASCRLLNKVDFGKLETSALLKYGRHFNLLDLDSNPSREHLVDVVEKHFTSQQLDELQVISSFVQAAKRLKTVYA